MSEVAQTQVNKIERVQLDGLVLLKIIKHCKESLPDYVSGQLLGVDLTSTLEVTFSFPLLNDTDENNDEGNYEVDMLNALTAVHIDNNNVGWYQCTSLSDFYNADMVNCHLSYQREIPNAIVLLFDPIKTTKGYLALKAFRLTDNFMTLASKEDFSAKSLKEHNVDWTKIFEEVPIDIANSMLVHTYLFDIMESNTMDCTPDRLNVSNNDILMKCIDDLICGGGYIDEYTSDMDKSKAQYTAVTKQRMEYQRRMDLLNEENATRVAAGIAPLDVPQDILSLKTNDPSRLESSIITAKIHAYCNDLQTIALETKKKQVALKSLMVNNAVSADEE